MFKNAKIKIFTTEETRVKGKPVVTDKVIKESYWSTIQDLFGTELYESMKIGLENTIVFKIRYYKDLDRLLDGKQYFVKWNELTYKIYKADFGRDYKRYIYLKSVLK